MEDLIKKYNLAPHPEGGYFKETYRSPQRVQSTITQEPRNALTHIYFLLLEGQVSRFHRVCHDEIWNFYEGDPIQLIQFDSITTKEKIIGPGCRDYVTVVPGNTWQAAATTGVYSLVGCTVAPGFDFADFSFLRDDPDQLGRFQAQDTGHANFL
jgi:predicted cupin superfamily sugar epimerase